MNIGMHFETFVARNPVSHNHWDSIWQGCRKWAYGDTAITQYGDTETMEMKYSCWAFIDSHNLCSSSWPGTPAYSLILYLCSSTTENCYFSSKSSECHEASAVWPHRHYVNIEMYLEAIIDWDWKDTWRPRSNKFGDAHWCHVLLIFQVNLETVDPEVIDLEVVDREEVDLEAVDLKAVDLKAVDLKAIDLKAVDLKAVDLKAVDLKAVDLEVVDLEGVDL